MTFSQKEFEEWISGSPYEFDILKYPDDKHWAGQYKNTVVQLAWEAWQYSSPSQRAVRAFMQLDKQYSDLNLTEDVEE